MRILYEADREAPALTNVSIIVGSDPRDIDIIKPGQSESKLFRTSDMEQGIMVTADQNSQRRVWVSDLAMQPGVGYEVVVTVNAAGEFSERSCVRPCSLD